MCYSIENKESGFTLVELLIAMTIGLIILTALSSTFLMQRKIYDVQEQIVEMVQTARAAMDMMTGEIRMAGYDPKETELFTFQFSDSEDRETDMNNIAFTYDESGDGMQDYNDKEQIAFRLQDGTLKRFSTGAVHWQPVAENIDTLEFTYTLRDGTVIAPPSNPTAAQVLNIAKVDIKITAKTSKPDPDYTDPTYGDHYRRYTLTSAITPRNL